MGERSKVTRLVEDAKTTVVKKLRETGAGSELIASILASSEHLLILQNEDVSSVIFEASRGNRSISFQSEGPSDLDEPTFFFSEAPEGIDATDHITILLNWNNEDQRAHAVDAVVSWLVLEIDAETLRNDFPYFR